MLLSGIAVGGVLGAVRSWWRLRKHRYVLRSLTLGSGSIEAYELEELLAEDWRITRGWLVPSAAALVLFCTAWRPALIDLRTGISVALLGTIVVSAAALPLQFYYCGHFMSEPLATLLNVLGGLDRPTSGTIMFGDENISQLSDDRLSEIRASRIGFVFQAYNLIPVLSVEENVEYVMLLQGLPARERRDRSRAILDEVGLEVPGEPLVDGESGAQVGTRATVTQQALLHGRQQRAHRCGGHRLLLGPGAWQEDAERQHGHRDRQYGDEATSIALTYLRTCRFHTGTNAVACASRSKAPWFQIMRLSSR